MEFAEQLVKVLEATCPGARVRLDTSSNGTVSVVIIWDGFSDKTDRARQQLVWGKLLADGAFERRDLQTITLILTVTPEENDLLNDYPPSAD